MEEFFVAILSMLFVVALVPLYLWKRRQVSRSDDDERQPLVRPSHFSFVSLLSTAIVFLFQTICERNVWCDLEPAYVSDGSMIIRHSDVETCFDKLSYMAGSYNGRIFLL